MWPFKPKPKLAKRFPSITIGDIAANWSADSGWEFVDPILQVDCMLNETDNFDEAVVAKLPMVRAWIVQLGDEITNAVNDYAKRSELPANVQEMQGIDMSELLASNSIDIITPQTNGQILLLTLSSPTDKLKACTLAINS